MASRSWTHRFFLKSLLEADFKQLIELDLIVDQDKEIYERYLAENGKDFFNSNAITSVIASVFFVNKDYTPAEHINRLFPKYTEFARNK